MATGASGLGGGPSVPPSIKDTEAQAMVEVTKKYVLALVADTLYEVIPFTQREYDEVFKYKAESDRPTLHPLLHLRHSGIEAYVIEDRRWQAIYEELFAALPENVRGWLEWEMSKPFQDRDPSYVTVINLLNFAAKALSWLSIAIQPIQPNSIEEKSYLLAIALPYIALREALYQSESVFNGLNFWFEEMGPNDPAYDSYVAILAESNRLQTRLENLKNAIAEGEPESSLQWRFNDLATSFHHLIARADSIDHRFAILGTQLQLMQTVSEALALPHGSRPISLVGAMSTNQISSENESAINGAAYGAVVDTLVDGLLNTVSTGPRAEITEMTALQTALTEL